MGGWMDAAFRLAANRIESVTEIRGEVERLSHLTCSRRIWSNMRSEQRRRRRKIGSNTGRNGQSTTRGSRKSGGGRVSDGLGT